MEDYERALCASGFHVYCDVWEADIGEVLDCEREPVEAALQPLTGELLQYKTANTDDDARVDVSAQGFWGNKRQLAFFDVRVFNPNAPSCSNSSMASMYMTT